MFCSDAPSEQPSQVSLEQVVPPHLLQQVAEMKRQLQEGNRQMNAMEVLAQLGRQLRERQPMGMEEGTDQQINQGMSGPAAAPGMLDIQQLRMGDQMHGDMSGQGLQLSALGVPDIMQMGLSGHGLQPTAQDLQNLALQSSHGLVPQMANVVTQPTVTMASMVTPEQVLSQQLPLANQAVQRDLMGHDQLARPPGPDVDLPPLSVTPQQSYPIGEEEHKRDAVSEDDEVRHV